MTTEPEYSMGAEFDELDADTKHIVRDLVEKTAADGDARSVPWNGGEVYSYRHPGGGISWGVNGGAKGFCIARGIARPKTS